jgi:type IV secretion system protein VirD4
MRKHRVKQKLRNGWRAGYIERCKSGSEGGSRKPDPVMGKGVGGLPYSIRVGCHIQVAFAPNDLETCEYLSKSTGQITVLKENFSESFQEGKLFGGKSRQTSLQEVQRPLMTPDECRRLPGLLKNSSGDVIDAGNMLIFPAGFPAIYGTQTLYFRDSEMDRRSKILPPEKSDNLVEIVF